MNSTTAHLQQRYQGFCSTHSLWENTAIAGIQSFVVPHDYSNKFLRTLNKKRRLGQLAEQFVFNQIETSKHSELLVENLQIQENKNTLGELDALLLYNGKPIHLEIIYKFYLYDPSLGHSELSKWIGPNRKDSLIEKLDKLKNKQLPLLYSTNCKDTLTNLNLGHYEYVQRVLFKAQLFVPYQMQVEFTKLNSNCVQGFYINMNQLVEFETHQFFIPEKLDWFLEPHHDVNWIDCKDFVKRALEFKDSKQSPLFWMLTTNKALHKCFLSHW